MAAFCGWFKCDNCRCTFGAIIENRELEVICPYCGEKCKTHYEFVI